MSANRLGIRSSLEIALMSAPTADAIPNTTVNSGYGGDYRIIAGTVGA